MEDIKKTLTPLQGIVELGDKSEGTDGVLTLKTNSVPSVSYPIVRAETVWIKRRSTQPVLPVEGLNYQIGRDHKLFIGPAFAGPNTAKLLGRDILTREEEQKYMPQLINISTTHTEWDKILNTYWETLQVDVPYDGLSLNVGTIQKSESEEPEPINLFEWLLYKYCLRYAQCANSRDMMGASDRIRFYLWKDTEERSLKTSMLVWEDKATLARLEIQQDIEKVKSIIILAGHAVPLDMGERNSLLADVAKSDAQAFLKLVADKGLLEKAFVERLVRAQLMSRPLNSTLVVYDNAQVGRNLEEAALWLKQPENSQVYLSLRQQLENKENMV